MALTQESILSFLLEHGGKVKNSELVANFRSQINCSDPAEKQHNRDLFKRLVNSVAVVRQIQEVKFVVVKKRYQDFVKEQNIQVEESVSSLSTSFSCASPPRTEKILYSDVENNNVCYPSRINGNCCAVPVEELSSTDTTVKVLNISGDQVSRVGRSGAVFAVIAVTSPPRGSAPEERLQVSQHKPPDKAVVNKPSKPSSLNSCSSPDKTDTKFDFQCWENRETEGMQVLSVHQGRPPNKTTREDAKDSDSVPLEPLAHEWLVKCAAGLWGQIYALLLQDTRLAQRKDFMSGFTALHWAAKDGNSEMIRKLVGISRKRGTYVNINCKAHGGYTPLHIAAIHGHTEVMLLLVQGYGANVNERDNDGKKAFQYLGEDVSEELKALLGGLQPTREKTDDEEYREHTKGFNTISKLFQPHKKHKHAARFAHDW
ncbi:ankyrin repeat domain-containing protein SOWAHA [Aulostomus maculatus]